MQRRYVADRNAPRFLPFLLPHLRSGIDVLDVGCGVGSIALDLAPTIAPGRIVGVDADEGQLEAARRSAAERGIDNATFVTASVYELPFEDATFDVVYANAVLMYVREQVRALAEMRRVLRSSGVAAVTDDDLGTVVISPERPELRLAPRLFECAVAHEGGNARYSRHLRTLMLEAGFARTEGVANAPEVYGDLAAVTGEPGVDAGQRSREHTLIASLFSESWRAGRDLDLAALIAQIHAAPEDD